MWQVTWATRRSLWPEMMRCSLWGPTVQAAWVRETCTPPCTPSKWSHSAIRLVPVRSGVQWCRLPGSGRHALHPAPQVSGAALTIPRFFGSGLDPYSMDLLILVQEGKYDPQRKKMLRSWMFEVLEALLQDWRPLLWLRNTSWRPQNKYILLAIFDLIIGFFQLNFFLIFCH